jgi:hypothetical protein
MEKVIMDTPKQFLPKIIRKRIVIDDNYVRNNYDGKKLNMTHGSAGDNTITINQYVIDEKLTLFDDQKKQRLQQLIDNMRSQEGDTIAHESQHIHNNGIGYNYLANSDNIYECMMLSLADEMSAMMAGYIHKTKNVNTAITETINNLSGNVRTKYIQNQFMGHFQRLQQIHGKTKNLYEHKFDDQKIKKILDYYFTIDGHKVMNNMSKQTKFMFSKFMLDIKMDINTAINNQIAIMQKNMYQRK